MRRRKLGESIAFWFTGWHWFYLKPSGDYIANLREYQLKSRSNTMIPISISSSSNVMHPRELTHISAAVDSEHPSATKQVWADCCNPRVQEYVRLQVIEVRSSEVKATLSDIFRCHHAMDWSLDGMRLGHVLRKSFAYKFGKQGGVTQRRRDTIDADSAARIFGGESTG